MCQPNLKKRALSVLGSLVAVVAMFWTAPVMATLGGAHVCTSSDGRYHIDFVHGDGLVDRSEDNRTLKYTSVARLAISSHESRCLHSNCSVRTSVHHHQYLLKVIVEGRSEEVLFCEDYWDASPANCDCAREEKLKDFSVGRWEPIGATSLWRHNGSVMRLLATENSRTILYEQPRSGMQTVGVKQGTLLFSGTRQGNQLSGTARIFTSSCGIQQYDVVGSISNDERRIVMTGDAPLLDRSCQRTGSKRDTLEFEFVGR